MITSDASSEKYSQYYRGGRHSIDSVPTFLTEFNKTILKDDKERVDIDTLLNLTASVAELTKSLSITSSTDEKVDIDQLVLLASKLPLEKMRANSVPNLSRLKYVALQIATATQDIDDLLHEQESNKYEEDLGSVDIDHLLMPDQKFLSSTSGIMHETMQQTEDKENDIDQVLEVAKDNIESFEKVAKIARSMTDIDSVISFGEEKTSQNSINGQQTSISNVNLNNSSIVNSSTEKRIVRITDTSLVDPDSITRLDSNGEDIDSIVHIGENRSLTTFEAADVVEDEPFDIDKFFEILEFNNEHEDDGADSDSSFHSFETASSFSGAPGTYGLVSSGNFQPRAGGSPLKSTAFAEMDHVLEGLHFRDDERAKYENIGSFDNNIKGQ